VNAWVMFIASLIAAAGLGYICGWAWDEFYGGSE
jgi:hypothetical protein